MSESMNVSDQVRPIAILTPRAQAAGALLTDAIDSRIGESAVVCIQVGARVGGGTHTLDCKVVHSATSGGVYTDAAVNVGQPKVVIQQNTAENTALFLSIDMRAGLPFKKILLTSVLSGGTTALNVAAVAVLKQKAMDSTYA
jgi:hypothetical protein